MYQQMHKYFSKHPFYNGIVHLVIGIGIGAMLTYPIFGTHPVKWGVGLIVVGLLGHLYPLMEKK
ncbi:MAG: hypothetical protein Q7R97_00120 [Candidatus Daviesbacteria bacterium]|nr:hypothetical protein [Candidatus Daviesbacteria bacterium]